MKIKRRWLVSLVAIVLLLGGGGLWWWQRGSLHLLSNQQIVKNINAHLITKNPTTKLTKQLAKVAKQKTYSLDHPYTKVNPYRTSPLTALVIFRTDEAAKVSYTVVGKSAKTSITNTVNGGYQKVH